MASMEDDDYMPLVTANQVHLRQHPGICVACLREIVANGVKRWIDDTDGKTAICPHCAVDAVVPLHRIQDDGKPWRRLQILRHWRRIGFGDGFGELGS